MDWLPEPIAAVRFAVLFVGAVTIFRWCKQGWYRLVDRARKWMADLA